MISQKAIYIKNDQHCSFILIFISFWFSVIIWPVLCPATLALRRKDVSFPNNSKHNVIQSSNWVFSLLVGDQIKLKVLLTYLAKYMYSNKTPQTTNPIIHLPYFHVISVILNQSGWLCSANFKAETFKFSKQSSS